MLHQASGGLLSWHVDGVTTDGVASFHFVYPPQQWYTSTMNLLGTWLTDRMDLQLHVYQLKILIRIVKVRPPSVFAASYYQYYISNKTQYLMFIKSQRH